MPWETLDALIEGKSPVDLNLMPVKTEEEAFDLVYRYGYDTRLAEDLEETLALIAEAIAFVEHRLLKPPPNATDWASLDEPETSNALQEVPAAIKQVQSPEELILMAANSKKPDRLWACAVLKVLHTLVHLHNNPSLHFYQQASDCIISHFHKLLMPMPDGTFNLIDRNGRELNLFGFETKSNKPRESILIKLLCKKEALTEDVRDLVGVRIITHEPVDTVLAVDILRSQKVILFSNIIPSRSKNNLLDFEQLRTQYERAQVAIENGKLSAKNTLELLRSIPLKFGPHQDFSKENPSTLPDYKSIHITCRHFLRFKSDSPFLIYKPNTEELPFLPVEKAIEDGFDLLDEKAPTEVTESLQTQGDIRLAFPYEIQLMDKHSYLENQSGKSAHSLYKQNQIATARRRVLGPLFKYYAR